MSLQPQTSTTIPANTARVARAAFPKGNVYLQLRDELGVLYDDARFITLFRLDSGRGALSPGQLAMVTLMQFMEGLSDRQAADAVRSRIDWKYMLGLELEDEGFNFSVLSEFRGRLLERGREQQLFEELLAVCQQSGWVKAKGKIRTDSTHVMAAVRQLNRLELVGESLRAALNQLAVVAPDWLRSQVADDWFERYSQRIEQYRLPSSVTAQQQWQLTVGADGHQLLAALWQAESFPGLRQLPTVEILRQVWVQNYWFDQGHLRWREQDQLPPNQLRIESPYDPDARNRTKRELNWTGYTVHLSETIDPEQPHLLVEVQTVPATTADVTLTPVIHQSFINHNLTPTQHYADTAYNQTTLTMQAAAQGIDLIAPIPPDNTWQAAAGKGFDQMGFEIDWSAQQATCPQGHRSKSWRPRQDSEDKPVIEVRFDPKTCQDCPVRSDCTRAKTAPRSLHLKPQPEFEALRQARLRQATPLFQQQYDNRAGIEGTISQAVRAFDLRACRYRGLAKTRLQHLFTATAFNLARIAHWLMQRPRAKTRISAFATLAPQPTAPAAACIAG
jgi:transposase